MLGFVDRSPEGAAVPRHGRPDHRGAGLHGRLRRHRRRPRPRSRTTLYTCHEALLLGFEQAMTRVDSTSGLWYDTSRPSGLDRRAHAPARRRARRVLPRHRQSARASRPGPSMTPDELLTPVRHPRPGERARPADGDRRMGHDKVERRLPPLVRAVQREGRQVVWACDPMHGNTIKAASGYKTRPFDRILAEVRSFFAVHRAEGTPRRRRPRRDDRPGRHRMHRRRAAITDEGLPTATTPTATRASTPRRASSWRSCSPRRSRRNAAALRVAAGK